MKWLKWILSESHERSMIGQSIGMYGVPDCAFVVPWIEVSGARLYHVHGTFP